MIAGTKKCNKCHRELSLGNFYNRADSVDGKRNDCKDCHNQSGWIYARRPEVKKRRRFHVQRYLAKGNNREKSNKRRREYHAKHKDRDYEIHKISSDKYRVRQKARHRLRYMVSVGKIVRGLCVICGNPKTQGHHADYTKPLDVQWLCAKHHGETHRKSKIVNGAPVLIAGAN